MSAGSTGVPGGAGTALKAGAGPQTEGPDPGRAGAQTLPGGVDALLRSPLLWALWGLAMAAMGVGLPQWDWPPTLGGVSALVFCAVLAAVTAQPYTGRQIIVSSHLHHNLVIHRNTLLSAGFVILVAGGRPPAAWEAAVDAALLAGYLLLLDAVTVPFPVLRRLAHPLFLLGAAGLTAAATALVALPGTDSTLREVAVAAASVSVLATVMATGFRSTESRRVGSRGPEAPQTDKARR